jgi:hypothetical protein
MVCLSVSLGLAGCHPAQGGDSVERMRLMLVGIIQNKCSIVNYSIAAAGRGGAYNLLNRNRSAN